MKQYDRNVGRYLLIERIESNEYGDDVCLGTVKYHCRQSLVEKILKSDITYLKKNVEGVMIFNNVKYDVVLYYNVLLNHVYDYSDEKQKELTKEFIGTI